MPRSIFPRAVMRFACALAVFSAHSALSAPAAAQREIQTISTIGRYRTPGTRAVGDAIVRVTREAPVAKAAWNAVQVRAYNAVNVEPQVKSLAGSLATAREANKFNVQTAREALDLALVFCVSKDSRYYGHAMSRLRLFRTAFNPAVELPAIQTNHQYHLLYARDWLPTLVYVYDILYNVTPAAERERTERWLRQMTSTLARQDVWERWKNTTHGSWQAAALGVVGAALQDDAMLALAEKRIRYQMQTLLGPEGFWAGGSLTLHYTATRAFLAYAEATLHNKVSAYSWCNTRGESYIKSAVTAPLMLLDPFAEIPGNDHAETKTVPPDMCLIGALRFNDALLASIAFSQTTNVDEETLLMYFKLPDKIVRPQARPPHSVICPTLGWAVLRTGIAAPDKDLYARLDYGPQGDETGHADKLDLYFCGNGRRVMSCDDNYPPASPLRFEWAKQTLAHNTVVINYQSQIGASSIEDASGVPGRLTLFDRMMGVSIVEAEAVMAYPNTTLRTYRRTVAMTDEYLLDVFNITSLRSFTADWVMHGLGNAVTVSNAIHGERSLNNDAIRTSLLGSSESGYEWIEDVTTYNANEQWSAIWASGLRTIMMGQPGTRLITGRAGGTVTMEGMRVADRTYTEIPLIARREHVFQTRFIAAHEIMSSDAPEIQSFSRLEVTGEFLAVEIVTRRYRDLFFIQPKLEAREFLIDVSHQIDLEPRRYGFVRFDKASGKLIRAINTKVSVLE